MGQWTLVKARGAFNAKLRVARFAIIAPRACGGMLNMLCSGMANSYPTIIPGLRSPFDQVKGIVYFGRLLDKIRLAAAGKLPEGWQPMRGTALKGTFDSRCCKFL